MAKEQGQTHQTPAIHRFYLRHLRQSFAQLTQEQLAEKINFSAEKDFLEITLAALSLQTYPPDKYEVVIINDGSTDLKVPYQMNYTRQENKGRSAARNRGIENAKGKTIIFLDDDCIPTPKCLRKFGPLSKTRLWYNTHLLERSFRWRNENESSFRESRAERTPRDPFLAKELRAAILRPHR